MMLVASSASWQQRLTASYSSRACIFRQSCSSSSSSRSSPSSSSSSSSSMLKARSFSSTLSTRSHRHSLTSSSSSLNSLLSRCSSHTPSSSSSSSPPRSSSHSRFFSMSSDKLRRVVYEHLPLPVFSPRTQRRQALAKSRPHYMTHEEFQLARCPFPAPIVSKLPLTHRALSPASLLQQLNAEELQRMKTQHPSHRDRFQSGDRICVTKYITLADKSKVERVSGLVISRAGGTGLNAHFTIRNIKLEEAFELQLPLWSPFIVRIDVLERGPRRFERRKMYFMRERPRGDYETVLREVLPKTATGQRSLLKGTPMFIQKEKEANEAKRVAKEAQRAERQTAKTVQDTADHKAEGDKDKQS